MRGMIARTVGQIDPTIQPLNDRMFVSNQPGYKDNSGGAFDTPDVTAAKKLLTDAGYTFGADGSQPVEVAAPRLLSLALSDQLSLALWL